jgi:branched-chain amino acid transport system ATP-binding protein
MLSCRGLSVGYGGVLAVMDIDLTVQAGEIVTLIGANGAGKSTVLKCLSGLLPPTTGDIEFEGRSIGALPAEQIAGLGIIHTPEGRRIFPGMTVDENLEVGTYPWRTKASTRFDTDLDRVFRLFPNLRERRMQAGWSMSGGEQQMLAIGRSLMSRPKILLLDEPSLGLAPLIIEHLFQTITRINREEGVTILLVEQNAHVALATASRGYVIENGRIVLSDACAALLRSPTVKKAYLGG